MMFWNRNKKDKATIANEKKRFNHLLSVAEKLPVKALPDLIRAIVRPVQSDFLLAVAEEGTDARPDMTPQEFFFKGLTQIQSYEKMKECEMNGADYPLSLASDIVLPWPWRGSVGISAITPAKRFLPDGNHLFSVRSCS